MTKVCIMFGDLGFFRIKTGEWIEGDNDTAFILLPDDDDVSPEHKKILNQYEESAKAAYYWLHSNSSRANDQVKTIEEIWKDAVMRGTFSHVCTMEPARSVLAFNDGVDQQNKIQAFVESVSRDIILEALDNLAAYAQLIKINGENDGLKDGFNEAYEHLKKLVEGDTKIRVEKANTGRKMIEELECIAKSYI